MAGGGTLIHSRWLFGACVLPPCLQLASNEPQTCPHTRFLADVPHRTETRCSAIRDIVTSSHFFSRLTKTGAVGVRLQVYDTTFCFVNPLLSGSAAAAGLASRNQEYQALTEKMRFGLYRGIEDHGHVFWLGNLNYRLELPVKHQSLVAKELVAREDWGPLLSHDQLRLERETDTSKRAFAGYLEAPISFAPTYKFDKNSASYDRSDKATIPAWTDRIIFKSSGHLTCQPLFYGADFALRLSLHRPVVGVFRVETRETDHAQLRQIREEILEDTGPLSVTVKVDRSAGLVVEDLKRVMDEW